MNESAIDHTVDVVHHGLRAATSAAWRHVASMGASSAAPEQCYGDVESGCGQWFNEF